MTIQKYGNVRKFCFYHVNVLPDISDEYVVVHAMSSDPFALAMTNYRIEYNNV